MEDSKQIFFLCSLPRSGNTLFSSIMNQNPDIGCTPHSIMPVIMDQLSSITGMSIFRNFPDHKSLDNLKSAIYESYYKDWSNKYIIERTPIMHEKYLGFVKKHLNQPVKCIIIWRDLMDVFASYIKWIENEPTAFPNQMFPGGTIEQKIMALTNRGGAIATNLESIRNALQPENRHMCYVLTYDELVSDTENQIDKIYDFLEIPKFQHRFKDLDQFTVNGMHYDDIDMGSNFHTIKSEIKKEKNPYRDMIPESIVNRYGHITFENLSLCKHSRLM